MNREYEAAGQAAAAVEALVEPEPCLEVRNLSLHYAKIRQALNKIRLTIPRQRVTALIGPSGCGNNLLNSQELSSPRSSWSCVALLLIAIHTAALHEISYGLVVSSNASINGLVISRIQTADPSGESEDNTTTEQFAKL
ncbi:MAG: hypothetical protein OXH27_08355 [Gammaproteobacteria bacterium]|nr:hypothetical protein [Gammaproteobacteria bacterium]